MTSLAQLQQHNGVIEAKDIAPVNAGFFDLQSFELLQRVAKAFSTSSLVPQQYQGNIPNCLIALDMAQRMRANPLMVMQNLYVVHGTPSWSSKFLIATINVCGRFTALRYEWRGKPGADDYGCRAWAVERDTGESLYGVWVDWNMVRREGWDKKKGSKWMTMPDQMFVYRAAAFWQRAYAPELGMGLMTTEEVNDTFDASKQADGSFTVVIDDLKPEPETKPEPKAIEQKPAVVVQEKPKPAQEAKPAPEPKPVREPRTTQPRGRRAQPQPSEME